MGASQSPVAGPARDAPTVLVIDDDPGTRALVGRALGREGIRVREAADAERGLSLADADPPDLVLLDVMLPRISGFDALPRFRERGLPVILLTGRDEVTDRVLGLELGADDYVVKPFDPRELASRVRAVLRRVEGHEIRTPTRLVFDGLAIDLQTREVLVDGQLAELTAREFDLLAYLAGQPRRVCTHQELLEQVWQSSPSWQSAATVTEHVRRIRGKIEPDAARPRWITTARGVGYRFEP